MRAESSDALAKWIKLLPAGLRFQFFKSLLTVFNGVLPVGVIIYEGGF